MFPKQLGTCVLKKGKTTVLIKAVYEMMVSLQFYSIGCEKLGRDGYHL